MNRKSVRALGAAATLAAAATAAVLTALPAGAATSIAYVAPTGTASGSNGSCATAGFHTIQSAVNAVSTGGFVIVCAGTYKESVTISHRLSLMGNAGAIIDATGQAYGVGVAASNSSVSGLTVKNANAADGPADGIVTAGFGPQGPVVANNVTITKNTLTGNAGAGIDLESTAGSLVSGNVANGNGIGINVADDLGAPATRNTITNNTTNGNTGGCGIALADHSGLGITNNVITGNTANDNGLSTPTAPDASAGSGIILASPVPGGVVTGNLIASNTFNGNGHGGVVVHSHLPGSNFSGNQVVSNTIGTNNLRTDSHDLKTTGIYLGSVAPMSILVTGNKIGPDYYGIFTAGAVTVSGTNTNTSVTVPLGSVAAY